jgi:hypothetical protein
MLDRDRNLRAALESSLLCYLLFCEKHILSNSHSAALRASIPDEVWSGAVLPAVQEVIYSKTEEEKDASVERLRQLSSASPTFFNYVEKNVMPDQKHFCQAYLQYVRTGNEHSSQGVESKHHKHKSGMGSATKADFPVVIEKHLRLMHDEQVEYPQDVQAETSASTEEFRFPEFFCFTFSLFFIFLYFVFKRPYVQRRAWKGIRFRAAYISSSFAAA